MISPSVVIIAYLLYVPSITHGQGGQGLTVGRICEETTECGPGGYCAGNKLCACLSTYVEIDGYCWPKINPGQSGCSQTRQCDAVWPGSYCQSGACRCANSQPPFQTRDGPVCLNYGFCPINGQYTKLISEDGTLYPCQIDKDCENVFECVCTDSGCDQQKPGICCPSRGFACIQPLDQGEAPSGGGASVTRYYYNSQTAECQPMSFRGQGGNANNFGSKDHCESYCKQTCARGQPEYDLPTSLTQLKETVRLCSGGLSTNTCSNNYECSSIGTLEYCCPTAEYVCSRAGGVPYDVLPIDNYDEGQPDNSGVTFSRFYYDESEKRCLSFTYLGTLGNYNNFMSKEHCEQFCSRIVCDAGEPLKDSSGLRNLQCSGGLSCPASHDCVSNVCCPKKQTVCKLPKGIGSCGNFASRWWFNASSGNCQEFTYSGCQGNSNNFATYSECQTFCRDARIEPQCPQGKSLRDSYGNFIICGGPGIVQNCPSNHYCFFDGKTYGCCPNQAFTCSLNSDSGTKCGPTVARWFYHSSQRTCLSYDYYGCDGNSNNFATQQDCKDYCRVESCPDGGVPFKEQTGVTRVCNANTTCPNTHFCTPVTKYSGNTFNTYNYCCPKKEYICSLYKDSGVRCSSTTINKYWFNPQTKTCDTFTFNGCEGNRNNFQTKKGCMNYCLSAACPPGTVVSQDIATGILSTCNLGSNTGCPTNYICVQSLLLGQPVCCGTPQDVKDHCPADSTPYLDAVTLQAMQCTPNVQGSCPGGYYCWYSSQAQTVSSYYCCVNNSLTAIGIPQAPAGVCPPSLIPHMTPTGQYQQCNPGSPPTDAINACTFGQNCLYSDTLAQFICCKFVGTAAKEPNTNNAANVAPVLSLPSPPVQKQPAVCPPIPEGLTPELVASGEMKTCRPSQPTCSTTTLSACLYSETLEKFICCLIPTAQTGNAANAQANRVQKPTEKYGHKTMKTDKSVRFGSQHLNHVPQHANTVHRQQIPSTPQHLLNNVHSPVNPIAQNVNPAQQYIPSAPTPLKVVQPAVNHVQPAVNHVQPAVNHVQPAVNHVQPAVNHVQPAVNHVQPAVVNQFLNSVAPNARQTQAPVADTFPPVKTVSAENADCSGAPGVSPIMVDSNRVQPCSPTAQHSCSKLAAQFHLRLTACLYSLGQQRFICCAAKENEN